MAEGPCAQAKLEGRTQPIVTLVATCAGGAVAYQTYQALFNRQTFTDVIEIFRLRKPQSSLPVKGAPTADGAQPKAVAVQESA